MFARYRSGTCQAVELFLEREDAETMLREALAGEPDWVDVLSVEPVELEDGGEN